MFAASSSGGMPPTNGMAGSLQAKKQRVHVGPQRTRNLQQHWANGPSSSSLAPYGSLNSFGTTAATAAAACPTAASPRESHSSSVNFSTTTTARTGPPATLGGDAGINGVTTAFASMGLPQVGASSTPQPLRSLQQQQHQQQDEEQRRRQQQKEQRRQQMQQTQEKKQQKQQKRQEKQQQKQQQRQQEQQQQKQLQQQLQEKQEQQQQLQQQLQQLQHQLLQQKQQLLRQKQELEQEQQEQEQQRQQQQQPQQQQQAQQHKHKQQKQRETQSRTPFSAKPIDLRLQLQTSKLAFITSKRNGDLLRAGFTLRRETGHGTVQEFLDKTRIDRKPYGGRGLFGFPPARGSSVGSSVFRAWTGKDSLENSSGSTNADDIVEEEDDSERGGGGGAARTRSADQLDADYEEWRDMTFAFNEVMGWVFLHHATEAGVELVHELIRTTHGQEMGIFSSDSRATDTVEGFASALESSRDVSVIIKGAIVHICGTLQQVQNVSKAIEAIANGTSRMYAMADWYWRGEPESAGRCPWYPMSSEADAALEAAYNSYKEGGSSGSALQCYEVGGLSYAANFKVMAQINKITGHVRPIKRMVTDRQGCPLPRCPKENMPITCFREGTNYSLVTVTKEEDIMVREAVEFTYTDSPVLRVEHVWNSFLWGHYAQNAKSVGNECLMFHGAPADSLNQICRTGFDRRLAGSKHGARFGQGCYFARDASYSALYMKTLNFGQILLAKVLVGEFTVGNSTMVKPPKMSGPAGGDREYDTTSDDPHSPQLIVTYKDWMAYPMYLITFGQQLPETEEN